MKKHGMVIKRIISFALALMLVAGSVPMSSVEVFAANIKDTAIESVTPNETSSEAITEGILSQEGKNEDNEITLVVADGTNNDEVQSEIETPIETQTLIESEETEEAEGIDSEEIVENNTEEESVESIEESDDEVDEEIEEEDRSTWTEEQWEKEFERIKELSDENEHPTGGHEVDYEVDPLSKPIEDGDLGIASDEAQSISQQTSYSSKEAGNLTPVRNQGDFGTCWAFATMATAEAAYKMAHDSDVNFSESQLTNFFYNGSPANFNISGPDGGLDGDNNSTGYGLYKIGEKWIEMQNTPLQNGGNPLMTSLALSNWRGASAEGDTVADLKYPEPSDYTNYNTYMTDNIIPKARAYAETMRAKNSYVISRSSNAEGIKQAIVDKGAVVMFYQYSQYFDGNTGDTQVYYCPSYDYSDAFGGGGHIVTVVGWDDSFDRHNFENTKFNREGWYYRYRKNTPIIPKRNGAWLVRNSWGDNYGDEGYFWISYEDGTMQDYMVAYDWEDINSNEHIFQYDGASGLDFISSKSLDLGAVYTITTDGHKNQKIEAVGASFSSSSVSYEVRIYKNLSDPLNPESGELVSTTAGFTSYGGNYTIELDDPVVVSDGAVIGVTIHAEKVGSGNVNYFVDESCDYGWISFEATVNNGETFVKGSKGWEDVADYGYTLRIKAITEDTDDVEPKKPLEAGMFRIENQEYTGEYIYPEISGADGGNILHEGTDYTILSYNNNLYASNEDPYILVQGVDGGKYSSDMVEVPFIIEPKPITKCTIDIDTLTQTWKYGPEVSCTDYANEVGVIDGEYSLYNGTDFTVVFNKVYKNAGTYPITITGNGNYKGTIKKNLVVKPYEIKADDIKLFDQYGNEFAVAEYSGSQIKPSSVKVFYNSNESYPIAATNYTVKYTNNVNCGTAKVTVSGKTNCSKTATKEFTITPRSLNFGGGTDGEITLSKSSLTYTGSALKPDVTVRYKTGVNSKGKDVFAQLKKGRDYDVTYGNNINVSSGQAYTKVTLKGNYNGEGYKYFDIVPINVKDSDLAVTLKYQGEGKCAADVYLKKKLLDSSMYDIVVKMSDTGAEVALNSGGQFDTTLKYDVFVSLKDGSCPYKKPDGTALVKKGVSLKIDAASLFTVQLAPSESGSYDYTGKAIKPKVQVIYDGKILPSSAYSISYIDNINVGYGKVKVSGKGNYVGNSETSFSIKAKPVSISVEGVKNVVYTGKTAVVKPTVKASYMNGTKKNTITLKAGKDYTATLTDEAINCGQHGVKIVLSDNYYDESNGTTVVKNFDITPAAITSVKLNEKAYYDNNYEVAPNVSVYSGKTKLNDEDFSIDTYDATSLGVKQRLSITCDESSNYSNSKSIYLDVKPEKRPLSQMNITSSIPDKTYSGAAFILSEQDTISFVTPSNDGFNKDNHPGISVSYKNNVKAGTASVTFTADRNNPKYTGSYTKTFKINPIDITTLGIDTSDSGIVLNYTGKALSFDSKSIPSLLNQELPEEYTGITNYDKSVIVKNCKISYKNNTQPGVAKLVLTGSGNYTGKLEIPFVIDKASLKKATITVGRYPNYAVTVVMDKRTLKEGRDYTISYKENVRPGKNCVIVTGKGGYMDSRCVYYTP